MRTAVTIAGSDSSGGAGIQADLKTMIANGVYGMSAITALTAQNTTGVQGIFEVTPEFLEQEIDSVFTDIRPDAVKIGMLYDAEIIHEVAERLRAHHAKNIVLDPVMVATSGANLISDDAIAALTGKLFPMATVVTPNIPEAEVLTDTLIRDQEDMEAAAHRLVERYGCAALVKGGHGTEDANDVLAETDGTVTWFDGARINNPNTHGTGCTLSSAIASYLALGDTLPKAIKHAKKYLTGALKAQLNLGHGSGPMDHFWKYR